MARLRQIERHTGAKFKSYTLDITYPLAWGAEGVEAKLASLCAESVDAIRTGHNILIISDRNLSATQVAIPALLALSAIHQHLVREGRAISSRAGRQRASRSTAITLPAPSLKSARVRPPGPGPTS